MYHSFQEGLHAISEKEKAVILDSKKKIERFRKRKAEWNGDNSPRVLKAMKRLDKLITYQENLIPKTKTPSKELLDYLLDSMPFMREYEQATEMRDFPECENIAIEFQVRMNMPPPANRLKEHNYRKTMTIPSDICPECQSNSMILDHHTAAYGCTECGVTQGCGIPDGIEGLDYEQKTTIPGPQYTYKPIQHFADLLTQVEGLSTRSIPEELYAKLREKFKQFQIPTENINPSDVRAVLKDIELRTEKGTMDGCKYYEDHVYITRKLNPTYVAVVIPEDRKRILKAMFQEVYPRFHRNAKKINPTRKNFLSYPFTGYKFAEHNGWREYLHLFPLLKSREKLRTQDAILKLIFNELGWAWRPTV